MTHIKSIFACVLFIIASVIFFNWAYNYTVNFSYPENGYRALYKEYTSDGLITKQEDIELKALYEESWSSGSFDDDARRYYLYCIAFMLLHILVIVIMHLDKVIQKHIIVLISVFSLFCIGYQWELVFLWMLLFYIACFLREKVLDKRIGS
ncbi:hypothetical protein [Vibrio mediterranei]|uniref:Uncharacterized protein n=1 Tax=Vibrio mediterranei TaxID=689 RepID=A0A3G4VF63_9VIBR|nr:hypothetical protein [Vibrio mediterranei]AYV23403.1 hypothetical protein ECB94_19095 [Vibrio mediterranei]